MGHGAISVYTVSFTSNTTLSAERDLGRNFEKVYLGIPTMATNAQIHIQASDQSGGTYRRICHPAINSTTVSTPNDFAIASAATGRLVPIPNGFRYYKIETTMPVSDGFGGGFKIFASDAG